MENLGQILLNFFANPAFGSLLLEGGVSENIGKAFLDFFGNPYVTTFLIAMLPIVELRGAIPFGYLYINTLTGVNMSWFGAFAMGFLGSAVIIPLVLLLFIPILNWLKKTRVFRRPANWIDGKFTKKAEKLKEKAMLKAAEKNGEITERMSEEEKVEIAKQIDKKILWGKLIGVFTFVAIPLPFTGVWTGSAVAAILKIDFKRAMLAILLGNLVAAIIITLFTVFLGFVI